MHKKLEAELVSLAHSIIQEKNKLNIADLKEKARVIYEKLTIFSFVNNSMSMSTFEDSKITSPNDEHQKTKNIPEVKQTTPLETKNEKKVISNPPVQEDKNIFEPKFDDVKIDIGSLKPNQISLKEELRDTVSADKTSTLFDDDNVNEKKTLNDKIFSDTIQVGLNDRIAFVKYLFKYSQEDFNRVLSKLNTYKTEKDAKEYILNTIKPNYNWDGKEEYEERLIELIERRFI